MRRILWSVVPPRGEYQQPPSLWVLALAISACAFTAAVFVRVCTRRMRVPEHRVEIPRDDESPEPQKDMCAEQEMRSRVEPAPEMRSRVEPTQDMPAPEIRHRVEPLVILTPRLRSERTGEKFIRL